MRKTSINTIILALLSLLVTSQCGQKQVNQDGKLNGTISLSGAFALYPMAVKWAEEFKLINPGVRIDISAGGAGKGITDALSNMVDLGMVSRDISKSEIDKGAWFIGVTKDAVLPTISSSNPDKEILLKKGATKAQFEKIYFTGDITMWSQLTGNQSTAKISVFKRSDACGAAEMWSKYCGHNQESLKGIGVYGDPGIADAVKNDAKGLGFNNLVYIYDIKSRKKYEGLEVLPLDINDNGQIDANENFYSSLDSVAAAISDGRYPAPPARNLVFVSKGKPTNPIVVAFLKWILTDGQKFVKEAGFVQIPEAETKSELLKLN